MKFRKIPLSKGMCALVSPEDFELVRQFKWYASRESRGTKYYAIRKITENGRRLKIRMHRFVLGLPPGLTDPESRVVDHLNDDGLDNRRENLEIITQEENMNRAPGWKKKGQVYAA